MSKNTVGSVVTASVVAAVLWQAGSLSDGSAGLTLSYATQFTQAVMWMFRIQTQLEVCIVPTVGTIDRTWELALVGRG